MIESNVYYFYSRTIYPGSVESAEAWYPPDDNYEIIVKITITSVFQKGLRSGFAICKQNLLTLE